MEPNFNDGEYILTDKISYRFTKPKRGDVVIFKSPTNQNVDFIKRIIALPGEKIEIKNRNIIIYNSDNPDGFTLSEPYEFIEPISGGYYLKDGKKVDVPIDNYIVIGDNRTHSFDSREWGLLPKNSLIGKAWIRYWPAHKFLFMRTENYN